MIDLVVAVAVGAVLWRILQNVALEILDAAGRRAAYQTFAALSATLLGLTMTTISVLASNIDKPIGGSPRGIPRSLVIGISKPMFGLTRALGGTVATALVLLLVDTTSPTTTDWAQPVLGALVVVVALRFTRVLVLLANLLRARTTG